MDQGITPTLSLGRQPTPVNGFSPIQAGWNTDKLKGISPRYSALANWYIADLYRSIYGHREKVFEAIYPRPALSILVYPNRLSPRNSRIPRIYSSGPFDLPFRQVEFLRPRLRRFGKFDRVARITVTQRVPRRTTDMAEHGRVEN